MSNNLSRFPESHILAHRGLWGASVSRNSVEAVILALRGGFGVEIDLRIEGGEVLVKHSALDRETWSWSHFLETGDLGDFLGAGAIALNLKSDGFAELPLSSWFPARARHAFAFDCSAPEFFNLHRLGIPVAPRISEYEESPRFSATYQQVWVDSWDSDWFMSTPLAQWTTLTESCYFVSPELHGRDPSAAWWWMRDLWRSGVGVHVCTDRPMDLLTYMNAQV